MELVLIFIGIVLSLYIFASDLRRTWKKFKEEEVPAWWKLNPALAFWVGIALFFLGVFYPPVMLLALAWLSFFGLMRKYNWGPWKR